MRLVIAAWIVLLSALPSFGQATYPCNTRSLPVQGDFVSCVSPAYVPTGTDGATSTADEYSRYQWNMRMILEGESYDSILGDAPRDVKVAVIDTYPGAMGHPDLVNVYETGINTVEGGTNADGVWDGVYATSSNKHGQCVGSIIAAEHNSIGTGGVFARARIIPVRASFNTLDQAIDLAVAAGAEVIHIAGYQVDFLYQDYAIFPDIGSPNVYPLRFTMKDPTTAAYESGRLKAIRNAIERAVWDHNVIVTTVVSNWTGLISTVFHAQIHETIVAGAVNVLGEASPFNSASYSYTILAPGGDRRIPPDLPHPDGFVTFPNNSDPDDIACAIGPNRYSWGSGGSFSGPHVAAAAAIVKSYLPNATAADVRRLLVRSAQPLRLNLSPVSSIGGMLSVKRLKAAIQDEMAK